MGHNIKQTLYEGDWLRLVRIVHWESCERTHGQGMAVIIIAVTPADEVLFVEQFRVPLGGGGHGMTSGFVWFALETPAPVTADMLNVLGDNTVTVSTNAGVIVYDCAAERGRSVTAAETAARMLSSSVTSRGRSNVWSPARASRVSGPLAVATTR